MNKIWNLPRITFKPFHQIQEASPVAVITTEGAWEAVADRLRDLAVDWHVTITDATVQAWSRASNELGKRLQRLAGCRLYAVGGGLAVDAAKYIAKDLDLSLVSLPTALSVDAFLTWASGVRSQGCVRYIETGPPEEIIVDFEVLAAAPPALRAAGICDVLSIETGLWDWRFAEARGENPPGMEFIPWVADTAAAILDGAYACAELAGQGDETGLKQLLDCLALEVQLCNQIGHSRPEEGSEHYFAYAVENAMGKGLPHGDLVGPGILAMAALQGQETERIQEALEACQIPLDNIPIEVFETTLKELPAYVHRHQLPFGIAHVLDTGASDPARYPPEKWKD